MNINTKYNQQQIIELYNSVGWTVYTRDPNKLMNALKNSLDVFTIYAEDKLIGLIRTIGDGLTIIYIQDLLIHPESQRKGYGELLIKHILNKYIDVRQIVLVTNLDEQANRFYEAIGLDKIETQEGVCYVRYPK